MAEITKSTSFRLLTYQPPSSCQSSGLVAGEALAAGDACYIKSDGKAWKSTGAAANAAAKVRGYVLADVALGAALVLFFDVLLEYATGLTPGADYYLSSATAGGLATVATTGGTAPIAYAVNDTSIVVRRSTY